MNESLYIAASGMQAIQRLLDNSAHNAVNAQTPGYQKHILVLKNFKAFLDDAGSRGDLIGSEEVIGFSQGDLRASDNPIAAALQGDGFFTLRDEKNDVFYTRNGDFAVNSQGSLVSRTGYQVLNTEFSPIKISPIGGPVAIDSSGKLFQRGESVGQLYIANFPKNIRDGLTAVGETLFRPADNFRPALNEGATTVKQGFLEYPPDGGVKGLINMLMANKNFEAVQKSIQSIDDVNEQMVRSIQ